MFSLPYFVLNLLVFNMNKFKDFKNTFTGHCIQSVNRAIFYMPWMLQVSGMTV